MDAYSPSPGYSLPIRAPLTIDSDSEFNISVQDHIYSRTSSFNSSSSIDISSYGDEHTSTFNFEQENDNFVAYPDEEIVIESSRVQESCVKRPFVRYPDANYVKDTIFRPFVKIPCEESSDDFGTKLSAPVAPLTRDFDSDTDVDLVDGWRWDDSRRIPDDGVVEKGALAPKVRSFNGDKEDDELQDEGLFSSDDVTGIENLYSVLTESVEPEGCKVECLNEVVKLSEPGATHFDLKRIDVRNGSSLINEIEIENVNVKRLESDESGFDSERIDAPIVSNSYGEIEIMSSVSKRMDAELSESDVSGFDSERIDAQIVSNSDGEIENLSSVSSEPIENDSERIDVKHAESDVSGFDSERIDAPIVSNSDSEIEMLSSVSTEPIESILDRIDVKLSESQVPSFVPERINAQDSEIDIKTIDETEQGVINGKEEMLTKMQRVRAKFLRLALNERLNRKVNGEGVNYNFDFDLTILAIGKTGVGKSATINSIFGENKAITHAFGPGTTSIQEITGNVDGIQLRVIDTPGLKCSSSDRSYNLRILKSIKRFTRKHSLNVVLYVDRLDTRDVNDSHLLKLITSSLGSSVWHSCIIALTHASCDRPNEPSGGFVVQRCRFIQEQIFSCGGNTREMANPVWLVDNHPSRKLDLDCEFNEDDACDRVTPFYLLSEPRDVIINRCVEHKKAYFMENVYRVKLAGANHWFIGCRLCI